MYKETFDNTFRAVFENANTLIKALVVYTVIIIFADYINAGNIIIVDGKKTIDNKLVFALNFLLNYITLLMVAIVTHRILLLGKESVPHWGIFNFSKREWSFLKGGILIGLLITATLIPVFLLASFGNAMAGIGVIIFLLTTLIIMSRLSLIFPAIAIEKDITLKEAWEYTKNYKLLSFTTIILFPIFFTLAFNLVYGFAIEFLSRLVGVELSFLTSILNVFITVFTISALSATYRLISKEHPEYFEPSQLDEVTVRENIVEHEENRHKIIIHELHEVTFEDLKGRLYQQYSKLGYTNVVVDKNSSWMIEKEEEGNSYVLLSHIRDEYIIEIYNEEMIEFLEEL